MPKSWTDIEICCSYWVVVHAVGPSLQLCFAVGPVCQMRKLAGQICFFWGGEGEEGG